MQVLSEMFHGLTPTPKIWIPACARRLSQGIIKVPRRFCRHPEQDKQAEDVMNPLSLRLLISLLLALATSHALAVETMVQEYMASMHESQWLASEEKGECLLQHDIPGVGDTKLRQSRQEPLSFELNITQGVILGTQCQVEIAPPPWRHGMPTQGLGTIKVVPGAEHIQAKGSAAQKVYQGLATGMMPSFVCEQKNAPLSKVRVVISPVRYLAALPDFQRCVTNLSQKKTTPKKTKAKKK
jgi:hypothetical protein